MSDEAAKARIENFAADRHLTSSERVAVVLFVENLRADGYRVVKLDEPAGGECRSYGHLVVTEELR